MAVLANKSTDGVYCAVKFSLNITPTMSTVKEAGEAKHVLLYDLTNQNAESIENKKR